MVCRPNEGKPGSDRGFAIALEKVSIPFQADRRRLSALFTDSACTSEQIRGCSAPDAIPKNEFHDDIGYPCR
jgi:hypothetical protein